MIICSIAISDQFNDEGTEAGQLEASNKVSRRIQNSEAIKTILYFRNIRNPLKLDIVMHSK